MTIPRRTNIDYRNEYYEKEVDMQADDKTAASHAFECYPLLVNAIQHALHGMDI